MSAQWSLTCHPARRLRRPLMQAAAGTPAPARTARPYSALRRGCILHDQHTSTATQETRCRRPPWRLRCRSTACHRGRDRDNQQHDLSLRPASSPTRVQGVTQTMACTDQCMPPPTGRTNAAARGASVIDMAINGTNTTQIDSAAPAKRIAKTQKSDSTMGCSTSDCANVFAPDPPARGTLCQTLDQCETMEAVDRETMRITRQQARLDESDHDQESLLPPLR